jgi:hypothetical protein
VRNGMGCKKNVMSRFVLRITAFLIGGFLVGVGFFCNLDTYSWFTSSLSNDVSVKAASANDLIQYLYVAQDMNNNSKEIVVRKAINCSQDPLICFSVEGEIANFILNINPVKLSAKSEYTIPIETDINLVQYLQVALKQNDWITGVLKVKYLNFINKEIEVKFSKQYLMSRFLHKIKTTGTETAGMEDQKGKNLTISTQASNNFSIPLSERNQVNPLLSDLIINIANYGLWDKVQWSDNGTSLTVPEMSIEQDKVLNILIPGFNEYIDRLNAINKNTNDQLTNYMKKIDELNMLITKLEETNNALVFKMKELESKEPTNQTHEEIKPVGDIMPETQINGVTGSID